MKSLILVPAEKNAIRRKKEKKKKKKKHVKVAHGTKHFKIHFI